MTNDSEIRDQAYQFFIEEAPELLQEIESGLLSLRQERDTAKIHSIMRAAHSLKGGSASVGLDAIKTISHRLETIFKALYSDTVEIDTGLETQLLEAYDCLRLPLMEQLQHGQFDAEQALEVAEPIFSQLEMQCGEAIAATADFIPSSEDLGISMAQSIFEIDVAEGLERLAAVLTDPSSHEIAGELRAQAEVFLGFAELLNLPGFGAIATAAVEALDRHPEQALAITQLALEDFQAGRTEVLSQPTSQGGAPSEALLALSAGIDEAGAAAGWEADWSLEEATELLGQLGQDVNQAQLLSELGLFNSDEDEDDIANLSSEIESASDLESDSSDVAETSNPEINTSDLETTLILDPHPVDLDVNSLALAPDTPNLEPNTAELETTLAPNTPDLEVNIPGSNTDTQAGPQLFDQAFEQLGAIVSDFKELDGTGVVDDKSTDGTDSTTTGNASKTPSDPKPLSKVTAEPVVAGLTVRVEASRLNQMNNLLGELTINRNGLELQGSQLRTSIKDLLSRFSRFQEVVENLRRLSDQMLIAPERQQARAAINGAAIASPSREHNFDSLEMDNYTQLYAQTQTLLEEIVQLEESVEDLSLFSYQSEQSLVRHRKMLSQMQDELMWARMIPLEQVLNRFPRLLRDLSNTYNKAVNLQLSGTDILVDKAVLSKLYDPLVQLLRNSFDHGIESPEQRQQAGKAELGQISIQARYQGRQVIIEVRDDGRGLNFERIRDRAIALNWLTPETAETCTQERLSQFIFEPGFSTAQKVSELSGRGVGLDIVRDQIQSINGSLSVTSVAGEGTVFTLTLPLTLTIINLLICFVGSTPLAIRSDSIQEILVPTADQMQTVGSQQFLAWRETDIPIYSLSTLLKYHCFVPEMPPSR
ncbi:MAG: chemotaxis protein CheA, partial [Leptolyngbya sp. SIO1D8]|nr:chemotaxis protein CheA [Leptolyngbya sp. SIO1D8]